ncbi:MAG: DUF427 domain-containing protein [Sphingomonas sp.]
MIEGNHYFPADAVDPALLEDSDTHTLCPWKGVASYKTIVVGEARNRDAAWYYSDPKPRRRGDRRRFAFWKGVTVE